MKYVALIRGINVGGNAIIKMESLKKAFEKSGFSAVTTYIQSGNVFFETSEKDTHLITEKIEKLIETNFKIKTNVVVKSQKEIEAVNQSFPQIFDIPDYKHSVAFLRQEIDEKKHIEKFLISNEVDTVSYAKGVLFISINKSLHTKSRLPKIIKEKEYKLMTIRNLNTTKKLRELMKGEEYCKSHKNQYNHSLGF